MTIPRGLSEEEAEAWNRLAQSITPLKGKRLGRGPVKEPLKEPLKDRPFKDHPLKTGGHPASPSPPPSARPAPTVPKRLPVGLPVQSARPPQTPSQPVPARSAPAGGSPPAIDHKAHSGLDSHWERKLRTGALQPDFTLDLHGHSLERAHHRLESGLHQARAMNARLVLLIAGKLRPVEAADRGERRGAIRAKILDWLAAGPHADAIAAIRSAHRRHGGAGALYLVLRRPRD